MGHIYLNLPAIPVPPDAHINHYDNRVFQEYKRDGKRSKRAIGVLANIEKRTMHVNENFRRFYPELWEHHYGEVVPPAGQLHAGLYAVCLKIGEQSKLYELVQAAFGPQHGNGIMDFSMYSMRDRTSTAQLFPEEMKDQILFSRKVLSDAWFSDLFSRGMTLDQIHAFRTSWLQHCASDGTDRAWLCIDGANNDCAVSESELAERGHAKSLKDVDIVSYMWAVDAKTGLPITWFVNRGGMPDCKAIDEVIRFLASSGIKLQGVILDRGFATKPVVDLIVSKQLAYIVMLKKNSTGFAKMLESHAEDIRWNVKTAVSDDGIFGITDKVPVFAGSEASCVALYFVGMASAVRFIKLVKKIRSALRKVRAAIAINPLTL